MISFVIPALNEENIIEDTIKRLHAGAAGIPHEVILSDDGSTDKTTEIAERNGAIVVRYQGELPKTIGAARNRGARLARFPIIVFVDSDVRIRDAEIFLKKTVTHFEEDQHLSGLAVSVRVYPETENLMDRIVYAASDIHFRVMNFLGNGLAQKCMIVRKESFERIGGFKPELVAAEDLNLFSRLSKIGKTKFDYSMRVYFSGRRAHAVGWPRLLFTWWRDSLWLFLFKRSFSQNWKRVT